MIRQLRSCILVRFDVILGVNEVILLVEWFILTSGVLIANNQSHCALRIYPAYIAKKISLGS